MALEPLATFDVRAALEAPPSFSLLDGEMPDECTAAQARELSLPPEPAESQADHADFLGRLHHFKNIFRISSTEDPVSVVIHKVGPLLIFDDGPRVREGMQPDGTAIPGFDESQLMLAELNPSLEMALGARPHSPPGLLAPDSRLCVKNTFLDIDEGSDYESLGRAHSAPGRVDCDTPRSMFSDPGLLPGRASLVRQQLQEHADRAANAWSLIPYEPGDHATDVAVKHWELLQCTPDKGNSGNAVVEALRSLYDIPLQPSRFGRAVEWRCGPFKILLGCDLVVMQSDEKCDPTDFASFKMLNGSGPSRRERLDTYLENMMCDISKAVWGSPQGDATTWRVFNTADLPSPGEGENFDAKELHQHSQQLLHFLRQKCNREGGTYWLFREANSSSAELFDLNSLEPEQWDSAFRTTPSLAPPIASLCAHLAQSMPQNEEKRQLLQKAVHLLEALKEEHFGLYAMAALELACSYMRTPLAAISDKVEACERPPPAAARLSVALRYLESVLRLLGRLEEGSLRAGLLLQAQVAYAECIIKLVREAAVPTYSAWLADVKDREVKRDAQALHEMKQLSAAFLFWRLFWLCRARRAMSLLPIEKREVECWTIDRDLCEVTGDTLYGLSRYPADDVDALLSGPMATAEGMCGLVEEGLRCWAREGKSTEQHVGALFLSKMNPFERQLGDRALKEDPLVRDDERRALWSEGQAMKQCLLLFHRAVARLRDANGDPSTLKVARKLAHLYNEEARAALQLESEKAEELLEQAQHWMSISGDKSNASRVLLNLSELHARRAERATDSGPFTEGQYQEFQRCAECCEEAVSLSNGALGRREGAFAHLRLAVHLSVRVPTQMALGSRHQPLSELADKHLGRALRLFDELKDEREVAVCHFHMADLALQEQCVPGAPPMSKARFTSALRHAKRSAEYWERNGALEYAKDFISSHVRIARLLCQRSVQEAVLHLASVEAKLSGTKEPSLRREMASLCQAGIRRGEDIERLKKLYRQVLRNEKISSEG